MKPCTEPTYLEGRPVIILISMTQENPWEISTKNPRRTLDFQRINCSKIHPKTSEKTRKLHQNWCFVHHFSPESVFFGGQFFSLCRVQRCFSKKLWTKKGLLGGPSQDLYCKWLITMDQWTMVSCCPRKHRVVLDPFQMAIHGL